LHVLYLIFNEGYAASGGPDLARSDLSGEAIRLARDVHAALPQDPEATGLLALMLLTDARRPARTRPGGELVPLAEQDRARWDRRLITEGLTCSPARCARAGRASTRCRRPSRRCTTRPPATPRPTGRRSWPSTTGSNSSPATRW